MKNTVLPTLLCCLLLLGGASPFLLSRLQEQRIEEQLEPQSHEQSTDPLTFVSTVALGNFRSFLINMYWIQADTQANTQQWYALRSTFEVIGKLQPYNPFVWTYNAWNLAYNISVTMESPQQQWRWIREGLDYAMQGAEKNPESWHLCADIGFYFWHKLRYSKVYQQRCIEEYGHSSHVMAARWYEKAHNIPGHAPYVDTMLATGCYGVLAAQALLEDDLETYQRYRKRILEIREHIQTDHADWVERGNLPSIPLDGTLLLRQITRHLAEENETLAIRYAHKAADWFRKENRRISESLARIYANLLELDQTLHKLNRLSERRLGRKRFRREMEKIWSQSWFFSKKQMALWRRQMGPKSYYKQLRQIWRYPQRVGIELRDRYFPRFPQIVILEFPRIPGEPEDVWYARLNLADHVHIVRSQWLNRTRLRTQQTEE
ncbi:MAG: hypothetical protein QF752_02560 [Planctomycetota bacterium]|nr:hypothetical protein [Planctomycetota bacterium]